MTYPDSLRQQARWIREALDPNTPAAQRIGLEDVDVDEMEGAAAEIERLRGALNIVRVYIKQNPLANAVVVPRGATIHEGTDLTQYPTLRTLIDAALGCDEQDMDK